MSPLFITGYLTWLVLTQFITDRLRSANKLPRVFAKTDRFKNSFVWYSLNSLQCEWCFFIILSDWLTDWLTDLWFAGLVGGWTISVSANVSVVELHPVNVTCSTDYSGTASFTWTSRSHPNFQQTGPSLWISQANTDMSGDYECIVETETEERKWAPVHLTVYCKCKQGSLRLQTPPPLLPPGLKKSKCSVAHRPTRLPSGGFRSWSRFLAVSLRVTWVINPAVGCHYFPPGPQLPSQPLKGLLPISLLGEQRHCGCEQFS